MLLRDLKLRGLKLRRNKNGEARLYWTCNDRASKLGFQPTVVAIHSDNDRGIKSDWALLEGQMLNWIAEREGSAGPLPNEITITTLVNIFIDSPASALNVGQLHFKTRQDNINMLLRIDREIGNTKVTDITQDLVAIWYKQFRWPNGQGRQPDHVTTARKLMYMIRRIVDFGVVNKNINDCIRAGVVLKSVKVATPPQREAYITYDEVMRVVNHAKEIGRISIALGTALQFEGLFRQKDVIGEWEPITDKPTSLYVMNNRQWVKGMTWDMLNMGVFSKKTVKRQKIVSHDVSLYPITMSLIQLIPEEKRLFGPVIIDERAGRPYANWAYGKEWLRIAREAGVTGVWNMDARAGGISEALASGGSMSDTQKVAGHSDPRMTSKYERMPGLSQAKRIAIARSACRQSNSIG